MTKNIGIVGGLVLLITIIGGVYLSTTKKEDVTVAKEKVEQQAPENKTEKENTEPQVVATNPVSTNTENIIKAEVNPTDKTSKSGSYETYSIDKIGRAETGDVVLFFHASWCPSCRGLNSSIESNLDSIPFGVTILKTDYDKETDLKKKYGVTYQHTLVQVDKDGNLIKKWSGGDSLDNLLSQIQ